MSGKTCQKTSKRTTFYFGALLHVFILFSILTVFFIFVISKTEREALQDQLKDNISKLVSSELTSTNKSSKGKLCHTLQKSTSALDGLSRLYSLPDETTQIYNQGLIRSTLIVAVALFIILVAVYVTLRKSCGLCSDIKHLLIENTIIFACVGFIEYQFFKKVASQYIPVPPSTLVKNFITNLKTGIEDNK
jgi:ABC-type multidrug transport system fused ATPase/permease subunit